jgi:hypothetical protein
MQYWVNHSSVKTDNVDTLPKEIRRWLVDVLSVGKYKSLQMLRQIH